MKKHKLAAAFLAATLIVTQTACGAKETNTNQQIVEKNDYLLSTYCSIRLYDGSPEEWITEAFALCREYENQLSRTVETSDVGRINGAAGEYVEVKEETLEVIAMGLNYGRLTDGMLDITVGELSQLWDFGGNPSLPSEKDIAAAVAKVGYESVRIKGDSVAVESGAWLDLGAIAKGYIAQKAADFLEEKGVTSGYLNFGGDVVVIGEKPDGSPFTIGVQQPFGVVGEQSAELVGTVTVKNQTVVTSGVYEREFEQDGARYHHILDPATGYPVETDILGVTIIGDDAAACDAIATACLLLGMDGAYSFISRMEGYEAVFVTEGNQIYHTDGANFSQ